MKIYPAILSKGVKITIEDEITVRNILSDRDWHLTFKGFFVYSSNNIGDIPGSPKGNVAVFLSGTGDQPYVRCNYVVDPDDIKQLFTNDGKGYNPEILFKVAHQIQKSPIYNRFHGTLDRSKRITVSAAPDGGSYVKMTGTLSDYWHELTNYAKAQQLGVPYKKFGFTVKDVFASNPRDGAIQATKEERTWGAIALTSKLHLFSKFPRTVKHEIISYLRSGYETKQNLSKMYQHNQRLITAAENMNNEHAEKLGYPKKIGYKLI